jgi:hypothetical protein
MDDTMIPHGNNEKYGATGAIDARITYTAEFLGKGYALEGREGKGWCESGYQLRWKNIRRAFLRSKLGFMNLVVAMLIDAAGSNPGILWELEELPVVHD